MLEPSPTGAYSTYLNAWKFSQGHVREWIFMSQMADVLLYRVLVQTERISYYTSCFFTVLPHEESSEGLFLSDLLALSSIT